MAASNLAIALLAVDPSDLDGSWTASMSIFALAGLAWVLTYALHSTLLLASAWLATRRMATSRAGLRERVWKFAVVAAFVTASLQVGLGFEPLGGRMPLKRAVAQAQNSPVEHSLSTFETPVESAALDSVTPPSDPILWPVMLAKDLLRKVADDSKLASDAATSSSFPEASAAGSELAESPPSPDQGLESPSFAAAIGPWFPSNGEWTQWAFASCMLGAFAGLLLFTLLWVRLNGCLRDRVALEHGALAEKLRELCARAGISRRVRLSVAPSLDAPISMGMFRPEICVPPRVLLELNEEEQEVLLAHELAHVVRRDPLWLAGCRLCEGVFFFQPLNRVARREIEDCAEFLSDAWAVRQTGLRFSLASCLTRIAEWIVGERRALPAPAMAQGRSRLRHRVELLLDESAVKDVDRHPKWLGAACFGFSAALIAVVPCVSATEDLLDIGDRGGLSFLPDRASDLDARRDIAAASNSTSCEEGKKCETDSCEEKKKCETDACETAAKEAIEVSSNDSFDALKGELDALAEEIVLLRSEAGSLDLGDDFAREIQGELKLLEMKLTQVRDLSSRLEVLRTSTKPVSRATRTPARGPNPTPASIVQPANHNSTHSTILEESTK